jgi:glycosyltransferase involved in cell wall biosynthesis
MEFEISVIIPAYNVEDYIARAIQSALKQSQVREVIVINDGSTDNTQNILKLLQKDDNRIKILHHLGEVNRGRSVSRNLGLLNSKSNYIAFLDGDDFYLKNRFKKDIKIFKNDPDCDGVYNAVGFIYYNKELIKKSQQQELYGVKKTIPPDKLFKYLLNGKYGHFQIDGLTVKRSIFLKTGFFNNELVVSEDTDLFWKMALKGRLITGHISQPVAMRGIHNSNIFNRIDIYKKYRFKLYESLIFWGAKNNIPLSNIDQLMEVLWLLKHKDKLGMLKEIKYWIALFFVKPRILFSYLSLKYFPLVRRRKQLMTLLIKSKSL